jgi:flagellar assembly factor FliW
MKIQTKRFGELDLDQEAFIDLPEGLVGLDSIKQFCLIEESPDKPLKWMQVINEPGLAFVVSDPYDFYPDYELEVSDSDIAQLGIEKPEEVAVLVLLTFGPSGHGITANLVAPLVICTKTRKAKQIILQSDRYTTRHSLTADASAPVAEGIFALSAP